MVCREWQRKIPEFLNDSMDLKEQQKFIAHVRECQDCYEELEIMYMLAEGLTELEEENDASFNFKNMLGKKMKLAQQQCERYRRYMDLRMILLSGMYVAVVIGMVVQIYEWL